MFALLLLLSFAIPYIEPQSIPLVSILGLTVPMVLFVHVLFILYWIVIGVKKQFLLSTISVLVAVSFSYFPYKFSKENTKSNSNLVVMNFNVRLFNKYEWIKDKNIPNKISNFISENSPDIITLQEFTKPKDISLTYPYNFIKLKGKKNDFGQAIYSKFKIINKGSLNFKNSSNNAIFADIVKEKDTIRIYNIHLESLGLESEHVNLVDLSESNSKKLLHRIESSFQKQQPQVEQFLKHKENCKYKIIICGDFNNTAYSWAYKNIKNGFKDTFLEAGSGFGKTYSFHKYPLRIDFILVDSKFNVSDHQNFDIHLSDHEPIMAKLGI